MSKKLLFTLIPALLIGGSAHAAFEWVPSSTPQASVSAPVNTDEFVPLPEKQAVMSEPLPVPVAPAPVVESTQMAMANTAAKEPVIAWNPQTETQAQPVAMPPKAPITAQPTKPQGYVEGFGRDIPLSIAAAQIVPSDYAVQYGQGANPDTLVSWQGGRDWKAALIDAVSTQGMKANITGTTVVIESNAPVYVAPTPMLPQPVPVAPVTQAASDIEIETIEPQMAAMDTALFAPIAPVASDAGNNLNTQVMWVAPRASTLRQVLTDWAREANVQLQWSAQYDYPLMSDVQVSGTFEDAVENILAGLVDAQPRPVARLHPNEPSGPAILVVETRYIME